MSQQASDASQRGGVVVEFESEDARVKKARSIPGDLKPELNIM